MKTIILSVIILLFLSINYSYGQEKSPCNITIKKYFSVDNIDSSDNAREDIEKFNNKNRILKFQTLASCEGGEQILENLDFGEISGIQKYSYSDFLGFVGGFLPQEAPEPIQEEIINTPNNGNIYISKYEGNKYYINFSIEHINLKLGDYFKPVYVENIDEVIKDFKLISSTLKIYSEDPIWDWSLLKTYDVQFLSSMAHLIDEDLIEMYGSDNRNGLVANYLGKEKVIYIKNSDIFQDCGRMGMACDFKGYDKEKNALKIGQSVNWYLVNDGEEPVIIPEKYYFIDVDTGEVFNESEFNEKNKNKLLDDGEFNIYNSKRPNIYGYKSIKLNENGELVYEYDKKHYQELLKVYGGQGILFFEEKSKISIKFHIEEKGESVFINFLKENTKNIYEYCKKTNDFNGTDRIVIPYFIYCDNLLNSDLGLYSILYSDNNYEQTIKEKIKIFQSLYDYKKLGEIYQNANKNAINTGLYSENNFNSFSDNIIKFNTYDTPEDFELVRSLNYLKDKYNNFYKLNENSGGFFTFDIEKDKEILNKFITDSLYYSVIGWNITNIGNLYLNKNNELYYIGEKREYTDHNYFTINYDNLHLSCSNRDNICNVFSDTKNGNFPVSFKDFINVNSNTIYFNISKILQLAQKNNFIKNIDLSKLTSIDINLDKFDFPIVEQKENFLNITSKIASPKDINTNPFMIGFNFLLALLYLITFYFTAQFFNSYFEKIATKYNINSKISSLTIFLLKYPFKKINLFLKTIITKINFQKGKTFFEKSDNFFSKNEHRIYVILGLLLLGIIGQITVDDFDVLSLKGLLTIFLMIFILGLITFFKDFVLYFLNKGKEKEKIKIENIPLGFILATIVASTGRIVGLEPNMLFGNVLRINTKNTKAEKHLLSSNLLFKVLVITFIVGLIFWLLTLLFSPSSFFYKFFIIAYFGIVNDVFFALLPFGLLWGTFILKNKKMKWKWLIFTFIVFCFLIHTILNPEGDLEKILNFSGNILILVGFLSFWIIITFITYFYIKKDERKITQ